MGRHPARLNTWYRQPFTIRGYHRGFYRPPLGRQPGWTFPVAEGPHRFEHPLPETWALMRVIDELRPSLVLDLHNSDFGGAWFVVNRRPGALADALRSAVAGVGLPLAETPSDAVGWEAQGPGVFVVPPIESAIAAPSDGRPLRHGASVNHYLHSEGLVIAPEVPLWHVSTPERPPGGYDEALRQVAGGLGSCADFLARCLQEVAADLVVRTPFEPAALDTLASAQAVATSGREWPGDVTPGHFTGARHALHTFRLRAAGMLLRTLDAERAAGNQTPAIRATMAKLVAQFEEWCAACEAQLQPQPHPLEQLVHIQVHTALIATRHLDESTAT